MPDSLETDAAGTAAGVDPGTLCVGCRYDLGGLEGSGICPECSLPVARTLNWPWLGLESSRYRRRLAAACTMVWVASAVLLLAVLVMGLIAMVLLVDDSIEKFVRSPLNWIVVVLISGELAAGWWFLTAPPPRTAQARGRDGLQVLRSIPRLFLLSSTVLALGGISGVMIRYTGGASGSSPVLRWIDAMASDAFLAVAYLALVLGTLLTHLSGIWYLARLATRLDQPCSQYEPGTVALGLRQTGWIPVYTVAFAVLAVVLYPVALLMVGLFGIIPIAWAILTGIVVPSALLFSLARSVWLVARFGGSVRSLLPIPASPPIAVHSGDLDPTIGTRQGADTT